MKAGLSELYGRHADTAAGRYADLAENYRKLFGQGDLRYFTAPGRTEIIGNHTDHNGGKILAASITMDSIAAAAPNNTRIIRIVSEGYDEPVEFSLDNIGSVPKNHGTLSLVAGMMEAAAAKGYKTDGFNAYVSSEVIPSAGVSSSASFEMLIVQAVNDLFNDGRIPVDDYARIGQYAENRFWDKASGLMDQMACAVGGTIYLDFSNNEVRFEKLDFSYDALDSDLVIVNTGKGHADLSAVYSSVPDEMRAVAAKLGVTNLWESNKNTFLTELPRIREELGNDRAILRALHFYTECERVEKARAALLKGDKAKLLELIRESGLSSARWLQNQFCEPEEQSICLAICLSEMFFTSNRLPGTDSLTGGVSRVHGGGFAGVIMSAVPRRLTEAYVEYMAEYFGRENVYPTNIRSVGAAEVVL